METVKIDLQQLITSFLIVIALEFACGLVTSREIFPAMAVLGVTRIIQAISVILIAAFRGKGLSSIGLAPSLMARGLKQGIIWSLSFGAMVCVGIVLLIFLGIDPLTIVRTRLPETGAGTILFFLAGGLLGPIAEEVFFRGIIYGFLRRWGAAAALLISSSLFALTHLAVSGAFLIQFIGGVLFAASYEREKSLVTPIIIHMLGNLAIFALSLTG